MFGMSVEKFCTSIRWFLLVKLCMVGWQAIVCSVPSVVSMKFMVSPCLKGVYQRNGGQNVVDDYSQGSRLSFLENRPAVT